MGYSKLVGGFGILEEAYRSTFGNKQRNGNREHAWGVVFVGGNEWHERAMHAQIWKALQAKRLRNTHIMACLILSSMMFSMP